MFLSYTQAYILISSRIFKKLHLFDDSIAWKDPFVFQKPFLPLLHLSNSNIPPLHCYIFICCHAFPVQLGNYENNKTTYSSSLMLCYPTHFLFLLNSTRLKFIYLITQSRNQSLQNIWHYTQDQLYLEVYYCYLFQLLYFIK